MRGKDKGLLRTINYAGFYPSAENLERALSAWVSSHFQKFPVGYPFLLLSTSSPSAFFFSLLTVCLQKKTWIVSVSTRDQGCLANRNCSWPSLQGYRTLSLLRSAQSGDKPPSPAATSSRESLTCRVTRACCVSSAHGTGTAGPAELLSRGLQSHGSAISLRGSVQGTKP